MKIISYEEYINETEDKKYYNKHSHKYTQDATTKKFLSSHAQTIWKEFINSIELFKYVGDLQFIWTDDFGTDDTYDSKVTAVIDPASYFWTTNEVFGHSFDICYFKDKEYQINF